MANTFFQFKEFRIDQSNAAMKVGVDSVILGSWIKLNNPVSILDIGAGTGLLSLMMAQRIPKGQVVAVELDENAILDARHNFQSSKFAPRLDLVHASIQEFAMLSDRRFDLIISNPPYFDNGNRSEKTSRSNARHQDTLSFEDLFECASQLLTDNGSFSVILPYELIKKTTEFASRNQLFLNRRLTIFPTPDKAPNRIVMSFGNASQDLEKEELIVRIEGQYTEEYKLLTQAFYL